MINALPQMFSRSLIAPRQSFDESCPVLLPDSGSVGLLQKVAPLRSGFCRWLWAFLCFCAAPLSAEVIELSLQEGDSPLAGQTVYAFNGSGAYHGVSRTTDAAGQASFDVPLENSVKFRVSRYGINVWSEPIATAGPFVFVLSAPTEVTLTKGGEPWPSRTLYAYNESGSYTGYSRTTDAAGVARFSFAQGEVVKFRTDNLGVQHFSDLLTAPAAFAFALPAETVVTVTRDNAPLGGQTVYLYDESGTYLGYSRSTDASGVARFSLEDSARVQFRVDRDGQQVFSEVVTAALDFGFVLPGTTAVTLTKGGEVWPNRTVYVYDENGAYTGYSRSTGADGVARFCLPEGETVMFRVDDLGINHYSELFIASGNFSFALAGESEVVVMRDGAPLANVTIYVYDESGSYTGESRSTDAGGVGRFSLEVGARVQFRVDRDGQQVFSEVQTAPLDFTFELPDTTTVLLTHDGVPYANRTIYAYDAENVYTGYSRTTDANGVARFCLEVGQTIKFRADYDGIQHFTEPETTPVAIEFEIPGETRVTLTRDGAPLGNTTIYVYDEFGAYTGYSRTTDAVGVARFSLEGGARVKFRVDRDGQQVFSEVVTASLDFDFVLPGTTAVTLTKGGEIWPNRTIYVYDESGAYTGYSRTTGADGVARFCLAEGETVKFRADNLGINHYSEPFTASGDFTLALAAETEVTVVRDDAPLPNITVYVYDESGAYTGYSRTTDADGVVRFGLADGARVKFRVDRDGQQVFSEVVTASLNFDFVLPGTTAVTLTKGGDIWTNRTVYVYDESGAYTGYSRTTGTDGVARFCLAEGETVKFRADNLGINHYSDLFTPSGSFAFELPAETVLTVMRDDAPLGNVTVYAYDDSGGYTGYSRQTNASGVVHFSLEVGALVSFRVDRDGRQIYSPLQTAPLDFTYTLPASTTVTLTRSGVPFANRMILVYDAEGSYTGYSRSTGADGVARFCLEGTQVRFRTDYGGEQRFSELVSAPLDLAMELETPVGSPPVFVSEPVVLVNEGESYLYSVAVEDPDLLAGDAISLTAETLPAWLVLEDQGNAVGLLSGSPGKSEVGTHAIVLRAEDTQGHAVEQSFTLEVNAVPDVGWTAPENGSVWLTPASITLTVSATDSDGQVASVVFYDGTEVLAEIEGPPFSFVWEGGPAGVHTLRVQATDDRGGTSSSDPLTLTIRENGAPLFTSEPPTEAVEGELYVYAVEAQDPDLDFGDVLAFTALEKPEWLEFEDHTDGTATLSGTPAFGDTGSASVLLQVADLAGLDVEQSFELSIAPLERDPPLIAISLPEDFTIPVNTASLTLEGKVTAFLLESFTINDEPVAVESDGSFTFDLALPSDGEHSAIFVATDALDQVTTREEAIVRDTAAPVVMLSAPADGSTTRISVITVNGAVDEPEAMVTLNGQEIATNPDGGFIVGTFPLVEGENTLTVFARDRAGNLSAPVERVVFLDSSGPESVELEDPPESVAGDRTTFSGYTEPGATVVISGGLAEVTVTADENGYFSTQVLLAPNQTTTLVGRTTDPLGNVGATFTHTIVADSIAPVITIELPEAHTDSSSARIAVTGTVSDVNLASEVSINGVATPLTVDGRFVASLLLANGPDQVITVFAQDEAGNVTTATRTITVTTAAGDEAAPVIVVRSPAYDALVTDTAIILSVLIVDDSALSEVTIGGAPVALPGPDGFLETSVEVEMDGTIEIAAIDIHGNAASFIHRVQLDGAIPPTPQILFTHPASPVSTSEITLYAETLAGLPYRIEGGLQSRVEGVADANGRLAAVVPLRPNVVQTLALSVRGSNGLLSVPATVEVVQDSVSPYVITIFPADGASAVDAAETVRITFSEPISAENLESVSLRVNGASLARTAQLSVEGDTLTLTPEAPLPASVPIFIEVPTSLTDRAGNPLAQAWSGSFLVRDTEPPAAPTLGAIPARTRESAIALTGHAGPGERITVTGGLSTASATADGNGAFTLSVPLQLNTLNELSVTATDTAGNVSAAVVVSIIHDNLPPALLGSVPAEGTNDAPLEGSIVLQFSEHVAPASLDGLGLLGEAGPVGFDLVADGTTVTVQPLTSLAPGSAYELRLPAAIADLAGNTIGVVLSIHFQTTGSVPPPAPILYTVSPEGLTNQPSVEVSGFATPGVTLLIEGGETTFVYPENGTIDATGLFTVLIPLVRDQLNLIEIRARNADGGTSEPASFSISQDETPPEVVHTSIAEGAINVPVATTLSVIFSEAVAFEPLEAPTSAVRLLDAKNDFVEGEWLSAPSGDRVSFFPLRHLQPGSPYTLLINTDLRDFAGNRLAAVSSIAFTTAAAAALDIPDAPLLDPLAEDVVYTESVTLTGRAEPRATVHVFGGAFEASAVADAEGLFSVSVPLVADTLNTLAAIAEIDGVFGESATVEVQHRSRPTGIRILSPREGLEYNNRSVMVAGILDNPEVFVSVDVGGNAASLVGRYFFQQVILLEQGPQTITAVGTLLDGSTVEAGVSFDLLIEPENTDTKPPIPHFIYPENDDILNGEVVEALLTVEEGVQLSTVDIDKVVAHQVIGNIFFILARLSEQGPNTITVNAVDGEGLTGTASVDVMVDSIGFDAAPAVDAQPPLTSNRVVTLTGTAAPGSTVVVMNGLIPLRTEVASDGTFSTAVPLSPNADNHLKVLLTDAAGNLSPVASVNITHDDIAPFVTATNPRMGEHGVPEDIAITISFSESLNPSTTQMGSTVQLTDGDGAPVPSDLSLSADGKTLRIKPSYKLARSETFEVRLETGLADRHGFALREPFLLRFETAIGQTTVSGVVVDRDLRPLANVTVGILGSEITQRTSSFGTFRLDSVPTGDQILFVDARPDPVTGLGPQGDSRQFGYLEFSLHVRENAYNSLGRPIFLVDTDLATATSLSQSTGAATLNFEQARDDLEGFALHLPAGAARFPDGTRHGELTVTRILPAHIPGRLPDGAIPHFLVEIGPDGLVFNDPVSVTFPNVYDLEEGDEVIVFHFPYGVHHYTELGRASVGADGSITTDEMLEASGFLGIVPADPLLGYAHSYVRGRIVDAAGVGIPNVSVNAIASETAVRTDAHGYYTITLPDARLFSLQTYATVATDLGNQDGDSPEIVFPSEVFELKPSGLTEAPDIVIDTFFLGGSIRYLDEVGEKVPLTGLARRSDGTLASLDPQTTREVEIFVYRQLETSDGSVAYDSEPYLRTTASLDPFNDRYDSSYALAFLGSVAAESPHHSSFNLQPFTPVPGDIVKLVAFDRRTGYYGEADFRLPEAGESETRDFYVDLDLRPPQLTLDMNRSFYLEGVRRRANIPHNGIAFTDDEFVEFKTTWTTAEATPLNRPELELTGRLRVESVNFLDDFTFSVRGGEHYRVLEIREALYPDRQVVLQRETDVGLETISVSSDASFAETGLLPIKVLTTAYGLSQASHEVGNSTHRNVRLHILDFALGENGADIVASGRTLPGQSVEVGGTFFTADEDGFFGGVIDGATSQAVGVSVGDSLETRYGETLVPVINALGDAPPGLIPDRGSQGDAILINGRHFSPIATDNSVSFNDAPASVISAAENQLAVLVPEWASSGPVTVTVAGQESNGVHFAFHSIGVNNGSFEDGTFRGWTLEGSGRVVERWREVLPTHRQQMAFIETMAAPRDGLSSLTSDPFEVPEGMETLLFEFNFGATALFRPINEVLECYIITESETIQVAELFDNLELFSNQRISRYARASGFQTAGILVDSWAGTGEEIQIRLVLKGRGPLPERIPGTNRYDHNPLSLGSAEQGTALFLDNFRLSTGYEIALSPPNPGLITLATDGTSVTLAGIAGLVPIDATVLVQRTSGERYEIAADANGGFALTVPFPEGESSAQFLIAYAMPDSGSGQLFSAPIQIGVKR
jgi:hypothetical protein